MEYIRDRTYNLIVGSYTKNLYGDFLGGCDDGSTILDVGVGNGWSLCQNAALIKERGLKIYAIDISSEAIFKCNENILRAGLEENVICAVKDLFRLSWGDYQFFVGENRFDRVYFSNSYSVIPDVLSFIKHSRQYIKKTDGIYLSTTLFYNYNRTVELIKRSLKYICFGIDFGRHITKDQFRDEMHDNGFKIKDMKLVHRRRVPFYGSVLIYTVQIESFHN